MNTGDRPNPETAVLVYDNSGILAGSTTFKGKHDSNVSTLNLPIGTNNSPAAVRQVLELPAAGESAGSSIGQQRYYNKADLLILVSNAAVTVQCGPASGSASTATCSTTSGPR